MSRSLNGYKRLKSVRKYCGEIVLTDAINPRYDADLNLCEKFQPTNPYSPIKGYGKGNAAKDERKVTQFPNGLKGLRNSFSRILFRQEIEIKKAGEIIHRLFTFKILIIE